MTISSGIDQRMAGWFWLLLGVVPILCLAEESDPDEATFELSPFEVSTNADDRYLSTNATSGTSLNIALKDLPMAIQVVNQDFLTDIAAANLDEGLAYAAGVFTADNAAPRAVGATRGTQGGGGDASVSSAGRGTPFANLVYIRGLSVPYQNRMGFRYGGIVKTPYSNIALGGLLDSANIERIEIVRGPNAVLYGTGVLSGIVNVIPERPLAEPRTEISISAGNYDYLRTQAEITGPLKIDWLPGLLTYRAAASTDSRGHWTDFREEKTRYWTAQLEYKPAKWMKVFLEYQDGFNRDEGTGPQWIYDFPDRDTEFRNEFDEFYNWARHDGAIEGLMPVDPDGFKRDVQVIYRHGTGEQTHPGMTLLEEPFIGGGKPDSFRISGPDTFNERNERNLLADIELYPLKGLTINLGTFQSDQETKSRSLSFNAANTGNPNEFLNLTVPRDKQAKAIWESGHVYGHMTRDAVLDRFTRSYRADPNANAGAIIFPWQQDDIKLIEYWWEDSIIKARTHQYRLRATYTFEAPFLFGPAHHTFLAGFSYIRDNVDFPDGWTNVSNARANRPLDFKGALIDLNGFEGRPVPDPFNNDGLYYRAIDNFEPLYFDGRNDGVDGHNVVRAGDVLLNHVIRQEGYYGIYQGRFSEEKLRLLLGVRRDVYNATESTYKRINVTDAFLKERALANEIFEAGNLAAKIAGSRDSQEYEELANEILAARTTDNRYIAAWYRNSMESGVSSREGYFGYANRSGAPDETFGIVPGSQVDVFDKDQVADTFSVGVSYDLTPKVTLYGLISKGITPNTALADGAGEAIPAEETLNREIGIKFDLMDGKLSGNLTAFKIRRENGIWYVGSAPNPSSWADARLSPKRASDWSLPTYDPGVPTTYDIEGVQLVDYLSELFGIKREYLDFATGAQIVQEIWNIPEEDWKAFDWTPPSGLSILERLKLRKDVTSKTQFPEGFAHDVTSGGASGKSILLDAAGLDKLSEITLFDPATGTYITKSASNFPVMYLALLGRRAQETGIRYSAWSVDGQPPENNNVDNINGASVTFEEDIQGVEMEFFYSPTDNLQFVLGYTHIEREAVNSFDFVEWESIAGTEGTYVPPFAQLHLFFGWENAGIDLAWVDYGEYEAVLKASTDGIVTLDTLPESAVERLPDGEADAAISATEFAARNEEGEILLLIDKRGTVINEANSARARDFHNILSGVSLNYNPEDELSLFCKYTFSEGMLERLSLTAGFKVTGPSRTSMEFNSVYLFDGLRHTPNVSEHFQMDLGASYRWRWRGIDMRLSINVYNVTNDTYSVTTKTLDIANPITGEDVTKRTEKFYAPTTFRVGLSMAF